MFLVLWTSFVRASGSHPKLGPRSPAKLLASHKKDKKVHSLPPIRTFYCGVSKVFSSIFESGLLFRCGTGFHYHVAVGICCFEVCQEYSELLSGIEEH